MLTKDSYLELCKKTLFKIENIEGLGDVGLMLFRDGDYLRITELDPSHQVANVIVGDDGERVFSDEDVKEFIIEKLPITVRNSVIERVLEINGLMISQEEVKKN